MVGGCGQGNIGNQRFVQKPRITRYLQTEIRNQKTTAKPEEREVVFFWKKEERPNHTTNGHGKVETPAKKATMP